MIKQETDRLVDEFLKKFGKEHKFLLSELEKQIATLYTRYGKQFKMTYMDVLKYLTDDEREEFQHGLKDYIAMINDETYLKEHLQQVKSLSTRVRVKRIELLKTEISKVAYTLYNDLAKGSATLMTTVYNKANKLSIDNLIRATKNTFDVEDIKSFSKADPHLIKALLEFPFSGSNYSENLWGDCVKFESNLNKILVNGIVSGKPTSQIVRDLKVMYNKEDYIIERLVRTETHFIKNQANLNAYKDNGVKYYRFVAREDERICPICKGIDRNVYKVEEATVGVNVAPMHANCRCTTQAVFLKDNQTVKDNKIVEKEE